jgi:hypothetical protein
MFSRLCRSVLSRMVAARTIPYKWIRALPSIASKCWFGILHQSNSRRCYFRRLRGDMSKSSAILAVAVSTAAGVIAFWFLVPRSASFGMFEGSGGVHVGRIAVSCGATVAGVILGSVYRRLRRLQAQGKDIVEDIPAFFSSAFRSIDMWLALVSAPIVYALLLQSTDGMSLPGMLLVALQNGFCCLLIAEAFVGKKEADLRNA